MIRTSTRAIAVAAGTTAVLALASCAGGTPASSGGGGSSAPTEMSVLSFSGHLNEVNMEAAKSFEEEFNVKLNWIEGDPAGNVAKVLGSKDNQIYDIAFVDFRSQYAASEEGAWEPLDESIVTNLPDHDFYEACGVSTHFLYAGVNRRISHDIVRGVVCG